MLQQQLGVSRGGDVGSPLLLLLLLELGLQRRRMFGFSLLPKSGAGGNAGPLLSQVSPISHIRKFCNGEKQSLRRICFPNLFSSLEPFQRPLKHRHVCCMSWISNICFLISSNTWISNNCEQKSWTQLDKFDVWEEIIKKSTPKTLQFKISHFYHCIKKR